MWLLQRNLHDLILARAYSMYDNNSKQSLQFAKSETDDHVTVDPMI